MFTKQDIAQINALGISPVTIERQIWYFRNGFPFITLDRPAKAGDGILMFENREKESGISVHFVNKSYDEGDIIFQVRCKIEPSDTPETLAQKIHALEYEHYPKVIEDIVIKLPEFLIKSSEEV